MTDNNTLRGGNMNGDFYIQIDTDDFSHAQLAPPPAQQPQITLQVGDEVHTLSPGTHALSEDGVRAEMRALAYSPDFNGPDPGI
jgi:hypothetical protein